MKSYLGWCLCLVVEPIQRICKLDSLLFIFIRKIVSMSRGVQVYPCQHSFWPKIKILTVCRCKDLAKHYRQGMPAYSLHWYLGSRTIFELCSEFSFIFCSVFYQSMALGTYRVLSLICQCNMYSCYFTSFV